MATLGGKREGAGRKKGVHTLLAEQGRNRIAAYLDKHLPEILEALAQKARVGDVPAIKELFDRAWGKAPQGLEVSGKDGQAIQVEISEAIALKNGIQADR